MLQVLWGMFVLAFFSQIFKTYPQVGGSTVETRKPKPKPERKGERLELHLWNLAKPDFLVLSMMIHHRHFTFIPESWYNWIENRQLYKKAVENAWN